MNNYLYNFIMESNAIEGIRREPLKKEIEAAEDFLKLREITVADMKKFVSAIEPSAKLRIKPGMNVTVGKHVPPPGSTAIGCRLEVILHDVAYSDKSAFDIHVDYETLHPFTDGNGRSGRMLWLWMRKRELGKMPELGFLHSFYYAALDNARKDDGK